MKKIANVLLSIASLFMLSSFMPLWAEQEASNGTKNSSERVIRFYYDNEDLVDVINSLAALKEVNIVLPVGPNAISPETKLTFHMEEKVSIDQAWDLLYTILDVAGYSMAVREPNTFAVIKTNKEIIKGALPVYVNVEPEKLPDTDQRIRYLYFMANVKVSEEAESELQGLLTGMLPPETSSFKVDPSSNAIIITAKANEIRSIMRIIKLLEKTTYKERMELVKLKHTQATIVANLFNGEQGILKTPAERQRYGVDTKKPSEATYFSKYVKVIADDRINALIVVGREEAVYRIKDFVFKYIDVPVDSGQSILHVHQLQYLDAITFAPTLQKIVESAAAGGTGQAQVEGAAPASIERYFEGVIVKSDAPETAGGEEEDTGGVYKGNNNLIIAARNEDWKRIKALIEELDVPQPQVILQVLVADLTLDDVRLIGAWLRNPEKWGLPKGVEFQAANLPSQKMMVDNYTDPTTMAPDLLQQWYPLSDEGEPSYEQSYASIADVNSTLLSFNDCRTCETWAILQMINTLGYRKVFSLPHIIAVNNKKAEIVIGESRFVRDAGVGNQGGTVTATKKWIDADLNLKLVPRIAFGETADILTLDIEVKIEDFKETSFNNADRLTREFKTISIVKSGDVIALGGLARVGDSKIISETPILGQIPILGYFFKTRRTEAPQTNYTIFIRPTIVVPKLRGGMGDYTQNYIKLTKQYTKEGMLFESLKDPITRWFFKPENRIEGAIDDFVAADETKNQEVEEPVSELTQVASNEEPKKIEPQPKRHQKLAARRNRGLFTRNADKLERVLADQENPFEQA